MQAGRAGLEIVGNYTARREGVKEWGCLREWFE